MTAFDDHPGRRPYTLESEMPLPRPSCFQCGASDYVEQRETMGPQLPTWILVTCAQCGARVRCEKARKR